MAPVPSHAPVLGDLQGIWRRDANTYTIEGSMISFPSGGTTEITVTGPGAISITHPSGETLGARLDPGCRLLHWTNGSTWTLVAGEESEAPPVAPEEEAGEDAAADPAAGAAAACQSTLEVRIKAKESHCMLKMEAKHLEREIKKVKADELRLQRKIVAEASSGNAQGAQELAKSIVRSRKVTARLEQTRASMHAIDLQLTACLASMSMKNSLRVAAGIAEKVGGAARVEEAGAAMAELQELLASGARTEEGVHEALRDDGLEEAAACEVARLLEEMELDRLGAPASAAPAAAAEAPAAAAPGRSCQRLNTC